MDENHNLNKDDREEGIKDILVSNGKDIVKTDRNGHWSLSAKSAESIFVIKPSTYDIPVNRSMVPMHFLSRNASEDSYNFPLWKGKETKNFEALLFGDTQARGLKEVNYVSHDVVEECIGSDAAFGVALGDIVADDPNLFDEIAAGIGQIGIPWYYVFGNHDHDKIAKANDGVDKTFVKNFGPSSYAFEFGEVAFISLNDVYYKELGGYKGHFTQDQLQFVDNYLKHVPKEKLVVLMMHIPIVACDNREDMYRILEKRPYSLSVSGHTHELAHVFVDESQGWNGETPHHHFINGTVSGSWWCGMKDE
ncbi:MAG: metallophosphoesterase, partial [Cyclobacteriaceae bacterium]|nr:metallophosphoesterase [Cyclobacteriaceae bacterium]